MKLSEILGELKNVDLADIEKASKMALRYGHVMKDLTGVFATVGVAEPVEGFLHEPEQLKSCVRELAGKYRAAADELRKRKRDDGN